LISEKKLIYAVLVLTAVFFVALLALPVFTVGNTFGIHDAPPSDALAPATSPHQ
jgi:hypothetical protein